jgi:transcriptional regulator with XRE-family HTH domain
MPTLTDNQRLRAWRLKRKLTQAKVASRLGVSLSMVSKWERGVDSVPAYVFEELKISPNEALGIPPRRYFPMAQWQRERGLANRRRVASLLRENPNLTARQLADELGVTTMTIWRHLRHVRPTLDP